MTRPTSQTNTADANSSNPQNRKSNVIHEKRKFRSWMKRHPSQQQQQQQQTSQSLVTSSVASEGNVSSPSILFESEDDSSSISFVSSCSSLSIPPTLLSNTSPVVGAKTDLSELYHNPYDPLSYVRNASLKNRPQGGLYHPIMNGQKGIDSVSTYSVVSNQSPTSVVLLGGKATSIATTATMDTSQASSVPLPSPSSIHRKGQEMHNNSNETIGNTTHLCTDLADLEQMVESVAEIRKVTREHTLASMTRLRQLELKRQVLRHQRFSLEQRLYHFCGKQPKIQAEEESERNPTDDGNNDKSGTADSIAGLKSPAVEGKVVVDWGYATTSVYTASNGEQRKRNQLVLYTGRLNPQGQPHDDEAILRYSDGQTYQGAVRFGLRSGSGINTWPDGQKYDGEWSLNSRNGRGTHSWKDGRSVTGDWKDGHLHGKIYFIWPNGAIFDGNAKMGKKDGRGIHMWSDGKVYNGHFQDGKEHGFGTLTLPDGVKYRGQFRCGVKEGYGIMLWKTRTYDGEWIQNKPHGQGRVVWSNGATYTGQFQDGKYHGLGVYIWPTGKKFVGRWEEGIKNGHGLYAWPNGKKYDGEYVNGLKEGYGRMTWPDGSMYCGGYRHNKRWGRGVQTDLHGIVVHCGMWKNDLPWMEASESQEEETDDSQDHHPPLDSTLHSMPAEVMTDGTTRTITKPMRTLSLSPHKSRSQSRCPTTLSSPEAPIGTTVAIVTPEEKRDISSPMSTADDDDEDDEVSGGDIMSREEYIYHQSSCAAPSEG